MSNRFSILVKSHALILEISIAESKENETQKNDIFGNLHLNQILNNLNQGFTRNKKFQTMQLFMRFNKIYVTDNSKQYISKNNLLKLC